MNLHKSFQKVQHFHSRHQKTTSNLLRINFKREIKIQPFMTTRASYVHNSMVILIGASTKMLVLCNFLKILMVSDKMICRAFRTRATLYKQTPIGELYNFHYLPLLYIGFNLHLSSGPFPATQIFKVASALASALHYLHNEIKHIHGDLKSGNVLIKGDFETIKLCDFGVALKMKDDLESLEVMPSYFLYL